MIRFGLSFIATLLFQSILYSQIVSSKQKDIGPCPVIDCVSFVYPSGFTLKGGFNYPDRRRHETVRDYAEPPVKLLTQWTEIYNLEDFEAKQLSKITYKQKLDPDTLNSLRNIVAYPKSQKQREDAAKIIAQNEVAVQEMTYGEAIELLRNRNQNRQKWGIKKTIKAISGTSNVGQRDILILDGNIDIYKVEFKTDLLKVPRIYAISFFDKFEINYEEMTELDHPPTGDLPPGSVEITPKINGNKIEFNLNRNIIKSNPFYLAINDWVIPIYMTKDNKNDKVIELDPRRSIRLIYNNSFIKKMIQGRLNKDKNREDYEISNLVMVGINVEISEFYQKRRVDASVSPVKRRFYKLPLGVSFAKLQFDKYGKIKDINFLTSNKEKFEPQLRSEVELLDVIRKYYLEDYSVEMTNYGTSDTDYIQIIGIGNLPKVDDTPSAPIFHKMTSCNAQEFKSIVEEDWTMIIPRCDPLATISPQISVKSQTQGADR